MQLSLSSLWVLLVAYQYSSNSVYHSAPFSTDLASGHINVAYCIRGAVVV